MSQCHEGDVRDAARTLGASSRFVTHWLCALSCLSFSGLRGFTYKNRDNLSTSLGGYEAVMHVTYCIHSGLQSRRADGPGYHWFVLHVEGASVP